MHLPRLIIGIKRPSTFTFRKSRQYSRVTPIMATTDRSYRLTDTCRLTLRQGDITTFKVDAIVNAAAPPLLGGGGVDGAIHSAAGPQLVEACRQLPIVEPPKTRCPTGHARITQGFNLPARYVIHTVGPIYSMHSPDQAAKLLADAHRNSLALASEHSLKSVAFPAISCGVYGYPLPDAAKVALHSCREAAGNVQDIYFVLFGAQTFKVWTEQADKSCEALQ